MHEFAAMMPGIYRTLDRLTRGKGRFLCAIGGLALLFQGCATAPPPTPSEQAHAQARAAYLANDYQRTLAIAEPLAIAGEPWAQYTLGYLYHYGRGVPLDRGAGKQWIQRAAEQGYLPAQEAMKRLSAPPPRTEEEINSAPKPAPGDTQGNATPPLTPAAEEKKEPPKAAEVMMEAPAPTAAAPVTHTETASPTPPSQPPEMTPVIPPAAPMPAETPSKPAADLLMPSAPQAVATPPAPPTIAHVATPASSGIKGNDWITAQDPQHYTVQLIGGGNEAAIRRFIQKNGVEQEAAYYAYLRQGQPWFTVVYGSYPDRAAARQALSNLPPALRRAAPWIRRFGDIHAQLTPAP